FYSGNLSCAADCTIVTTGCQLSCGDGVVQVDHEDCDTNDLQGRTCDDFGFIGGALGCTYACAFDYTECEAVCGDGQVALNEGCDDTNRTAGDGCDAACAVEAGWACVGTPSVCAPICGDGQLLGDEVCDDGVNDGGYGGCMPGCMERAPGCGDGILQADQGELCDGAETAGQTCASNGFLGGPIACWDTCDQLDLSRCAGRSDWSLRAGGTGSDYGIVVAIDAAGNVIVGGVFRGTVNFGGQDLTALGVSDLFLAKYDATGAHVWSRRYGSADGETLNGLATDSAGNILITGGFGVTLNLGGQDLVSAGGTDAYLAKLTPSGDHVWSKRFGDATFQEGMRVVVDVGDRVIVAGVFEGNINLGGTYHTSGTGRDVFLAQYNADGLFSISTTLRQGGVLDTVRGLAVDPSGNVYATGSFSGSLVCDSRTLVSTGQYDIYVVKLNAFLTPTWAQRYGSPTFDDEGAAVAVDSLQNVYVTGKAGPAVDFGVGVEAGFGGTDIFMLRLDGSGSTVWSRVAGSADMDGGGFAVGLDGGGRVWFAGNFSGAANFFGTFLGGQGLADFYIAATDTAGNPDFVQRFGGTGYDVVMSMAVTPAGALAITGVFQSSMTIGDDTLISGGAEDAFLSYFQ
ncbi:MAG: hypothetical protein CVU59_12315, partial [Deltaproteobacteria bacterium HGW-Deltaproteobacteria-17]